MWDNTKITANYSVVRPHTKNCPYSCYLLPHYLELLKITLDFRNDTINREFFLTFLSFTVIITTIYKVSSWTFTYKVK